MIFNIIIYMALNKHLCTENYTLKYSCTLNPNQQLSTSTVPGNNIIMRMVPTTQTAKQPPVFTAVIENMNDKEFKDEASKENRDSENKRSEVVGDTTNELSDLSHFLSMLQDRKMHHNGDGIAKELEDIISTEFGSLKKQFEDENEELVGIFLRDISIVEAVALRLVNEKYQDVVHVIYNLFEDAVKNIIVQKNEIIKSMMEEVDEIFNNYLLTSESNEERNTKIIKIVLKKLDSLENELRRIFDSEKKEIETVLFDTLMLTPSSPLIKMKQLLDELISKYPSKFMFYRTVISSYINLCLEGVKNKLAKDLIDSKVTKDAEEIYSNLLSLNL